MFDFSWMSQYGCPSAFNAPTEPVEPPKGLVGVVAVQREGQWEHPAPHLVRAEREFRQEGGKLLVDPYGWIQAFKIESGLVRSTEGWKR